MNPYFLEMMIKERQREALKEAERLRLIAAYEANRRTAKAKFFTALGEKLIQFGEVLKRRYSCEPKLPACKVG